MFVHVIVFLRICVCVYECLYLCISYLCICVHVCLYVCIYVKGELNNYLVIIRNNLHIKDIKR